LISQNLETYNLSVKLSWRQIKRDPKDYPWISNRYFLICKGGETEKMMKNYEELISNARVNNTAQFCNEISENLSPMTGKHIPKNIKWKLIMVGVFLSKGLTKVRHAFDVLIRVMNDIKSQTLVKGKYSNEEDNIIKETVQKYGNNKETWEKLQVELNRAHANANLIKERYERYLSKTVVKAPNHFWSIEEDKILIDCLFQDLSMKNSKYISSISLKNIRDSKANEKINRSNYAINSHYCLSLRPLLLQYHQGTINTPWKYSVLEYIYENKVMSVSDIGEHMTEINKHFPWLDILSISACYKDYYNTKKPFYEIAKNAMQKYKGKPAHTKKALKRCEEIIEYYDPKGELSEYKFCKIHQKCLKSQDSSSP